MGVGSDALDAVSDTGITPITEPITQTDIPNQDIGNAPDEGNYSSGGDHGVRIPRLPTDHEIALTGEVITDEEAQAYFAENGGGIISALASSGVSTEAVRISDEGYSHISYDGTEGKSFELKQNYRDYLVFNGDEIIAIITLYKENGEIFNTPSFGAKWFEGYGDYLEEHAGEELAYVYAGWFEIIIAPDNTYYNPMGLDVSPYLGGVDEPYELFYHEGAVYVP